MVRVDLVFLCGIRLTCIKHCMSERKREGERKRERGGWCECVISHFGKHFVPATMLTSGQPLAKITNIDFVQLLVENAWLYLINHWSPLL